MQGPAQARAADTRVRWRAAQGAGAAIAGYRIEALIGRGRGTTVHRAVSPQGDTVALKLGAAGFAAEHDCARALDHPHLLRALGHGAEGGRAFLAMEHCAGGDLARHPPQPGEAAAFMLQAAEALAHLHAQGWVHRDVKPANLLRRADGSLAVADFGSAARTGARPEAAHILVGSPRYAAPEQAQGAPADPRADVYALGVMLYEWLSGRPAYPGETAAELLAQHLLADVPPLPAPQAAWQPLLDRLLAKDARSRPADGAAVLLELETRPAPASPPCGGGAGPRNRP